MKKILLVNASPRKGGNSDRGVGFELQEWLDHRSIGPYGALHDIPENAKMP